MLMWEAVVHDQAYLCFRQHSYCPKKNFENRKVNRMDPVSNEHVISAVP